MGERAQGPDRGGVFSRACVHVRVRVLVCVCVCACALSSMQGRSLDGDRKRQGLKQRIKAPVGGVSKAMGLDGSRRIAECARIHT